MYYSAITNTGQGSSFLQVSAKFHLRDHLGNTRIVLEEDENNTYSETHIADYYPFGMEIQRGDISHPSPRSGNNLSNRYLYNSKELQDDHDLNWYDYGARFYDPQIGRFHSVDPLAEVYSFQSPFAYAANNPIYYNDYLGMGPREWFKNFKTWFGNTFLGHVNGIPTVKAQSEETGNSGGGNDQPQGDPGSIWLPGVTVTASSGSRPRMISGIRSEPRTTEPNFIERSIINFLYLSFNAFVYYDNMLGGDPKSSLDERLLNATSFFIAGKIIPNSKGNKLIKKLAKSGRNNRLPTPELNPSQFNRVAGRFVHKKTGAIYRKSFSSHGNLNNTGTQWKIWPKGTKEFGPVSKKTGIRVTIDGNGSVIGH